MFHMSYIHLQCYTDSAEIKLCYWESLSQHKFKTHSWHSHPRSYTYYREGHISPIFVILWYPKVCHLQNGSPKSRVCSSNSKTPKIASKPKKFNLVYSGGIGVDSFASLLALLRVTGSCVSFAGKPWQVWQVLPNIKLLNTEPICFAVYEFRSIILLVLYSTTDRQAQ